MKTSAPCFVLSRGPAEHAAAAAARPAPVRRTPPPAPPPATASGRRLRHPGRPRRHDNPRRHDYKLVPGDKLRIEVYKDAQLSQSLQVRPDGKITLPLVGDIPAAGRTSSELRDVITTSLKEYNTNPVVTVIVVETVPPTIYVMGEVNNRRARSRSGEK